MAENVHTISDLCQMQALPLKLKIALTKRRIRDWVNHFGLDGVYVSFSGGKDSTVLLHMAREMFPDIKAVFIDTGLEYPEIRQFVKTFDNVDIVRPKMGFKQVCEKYGFPIISKEVSEKAYYAKRYLTWWLEQNTLDRPTEVPSAFGIADLMGIHNRSDSRFLEMKKGNIPKELLDEIFGINTDAPMKAKALYGTVIHKEKGVITNEISKRFDFSRWKFLINAPFQISNKCCDVMKKAPIKKYANKTGRVPITAQMASESRLRTQHWLQNGCNAFDSKKQISNPMSFWTEQDVLLYIKTYNIQIAPVYGDIVVDHKSMGEIEGQMSFADFMDAEEFDMESPLLKTTGCKRTGCVLCAYGCHLEKGESRFERLKKTHPKHYAVLDKLTNNGVTYREAIDWINEHNGKGKIIRY